MLGVCGLNQVFQLVEESNWQASDGMKVISQITPLKIDISSISSLSNFGSHTVVVMNDGKAFGSGYNSDHRITKSLPNTFLKGFNEFKLENKIISAACGLLYTVYLLSPSKNGNNKMKLAYASKQMKMFSPLILKTGDLNPISLYAGFYFSVAINDDGSITFISPEVNTSYSTKLVASFLPDGDCAVCAACCFDCIYTVGVSGRVYKSIPKGKLELTFSVVDELKETVIKAVYGTYRHCFSVSESGQVFGCGINSFGCLGIGEIDEKFDKFTLISPLNEYKIVAASAGLNHSLFQTSDGKMLACGCNKYGQLPIAKEPSDEIVPITESVVEKQISFCIAGFNTTFVCIGFDPSQSPNKPIKDKK